MAAADLRNSARHLMSTGKDLYSYLRWEVKTMYELYKKNRPGQKDLAQQVFERLRVTDSYHRSDAKSSEDPKLAFQQLKNTVEALSEAHGRLGFMIREISSLLR